MRQVCTHTLRGSCSPATYSQSQRLATQTNCTMKFYLAWTTPADKFVLRYRRTSELSPRAQQNAQRGAPPAQRQLNSTVVNDGQQKIQSHHSHRLTLPPFLPLHPRVNAPIHRPVESTLKFHPEACLIIYSPTMKADHFKVFTDMGYHILVEEPDVPYLIGCAVPSPRCLRHCLDARGSPGPPAFPVACLLSLPLLRSSPPSASHLRPSTSLTRSTPTVERPTGAPQRRTGTRASKSGSWARIFSRTLRSSSVSRRFGSTAECTWTRM